MSGRNDPGPFVVVTCIVDAGARPAAVTRAHGQALERAIGASAQKPISGLDIVELPISSDAHAALRKHLGLSEEQVGVYDVFPLSPKLGAEVRKSAAQFLAAEQLWTLDAQGVFGPNALSVKLDLPKGWDRDPKAVHQKLVEAGALELSEADIATFNTIRNAWQSAA
jgi:hypothetical protein